MGLGKASTVFDAKRAKCLKWKGASLIACPCESRQTRVFNMSVCLTISPQLHGRPLKISGNIMTS